MVVARISDDGLFGAVVADFPLGRAKGAGVVPASPAPLAGWFPIWTPERIRMVARFFNGPHRQHAVAQIAESAGMSVDEVLACLDESDRPDTSSYLRLASAVDFGAVEHLDPHEVNAALADNPDARDVTAVSSPAVGWRVGGRAVAA